MVNLSPPVLSIRALAISVLPVLESLRHA